MKGIIENNVFQFITDIESLDNSADEQHFLIKCLMPKILLTGSSIHWKHYYYYFVKWEKIVNTFEE